MDSRRRELSGTRLALTSTFEAVMGSAWLRARPDWVGGGRESFRGNWVVRSKEVDGAVDCN